MAPSVELSPATFIRLQAHAVPLVDTIESVINRLLDGYETKGSVLGGMDEGSGSSNVRQFNPLVPPDLTHTKVLAVEFDGKPFERGEVSWNGVLRAGVRKAKATAKSTAELKRLVSANFVEGSKTDDGYRFLSDVGLSVQQQESNSAWRAACHIAQQLGCPLNVTFVWRDKEGAAFPGVTGQFSIVSR